MSDTSWTNIDERWAWIDRYGIVRLQVYTEGNGLWTADARVQNVRGYLHCKITRMSGTREDAIDAADRWLEEKRKEHQPEPDHAD